MTNKNPFPPLAYKLETFKQTNGLKNKVISQRQPLFPFEIKNLKHLHTLQTAVQTTTMKI